MGHENGGWWFQAGTRSRVIRFRDERRQSGLKPQTVNKLLTTMAAVLKFAARRELIDRNSAQLAERFRLNSGEISATGSDERRAGDGVADPEDVLSPAESGRLIRAAEPGLYQTYLLTAVPTGARVGELTALSWSDLDLTGGTMFVRRSLSWAKPRGEKVTRSRFYEPKTRASRRRVPLAPELVAALKRWKLACPTSPLDLVFPIPDGRPKHRSVITRQGLQPALRRAKLRMVTVHSLRHSFASALLMQGHPITQVAHLLGHSSPAVTMKVYAHWFRDVKSDAVADLARTVTSGSKTVAEG